MTDIAVIIRLYQTGRLPTYFSFESVCAVQVCSWCDGASEAAAEVAEDRPDLDSGDAETGDVGCQRRPREEPTNTVVISCHGPSPGSSSQT